MARGRIPTPHKRVFPNGKTSDEYYGHIRNEYGQKVWKKYGKNYKEAVKDLKKDVEAYAKKKEELARKEQQKANRQTLLEYLKEAHYFEPEKNVQYIFSRDTTHPLRENFGLSHSKQVASYFHRLFDEDKANDAIGRIPYHDITHEDVLALWGRLNQSSIFATNGVRNRVLDMLSSAFGFIMKDDKSITENPFKSIYRFREEQNDRQGMSVEQIRHLFVDEETINSKIIEYRIGQNEKETEKKADSIKASDKSEVEKKRLLKNLYTWKEKKNALYKEYRFTDTPYYHYFRFILGTGVRGAECRALQYSAFSRFPYVRIEKGFKEQNSKRESIDDPKWGKKRIVYLCATLQKMMEYAKPQGFDLYKNQTTYPQPADYFVFSQDGGKTPLCASSIITHWTMFVSAMGFEKHLFTPHSLRHSMAALLMENGMPEWLVVKWCGWEISVINDMVKNYANKKWDYEFPEYEDLIAPLIEEEYFSTRK